MRIITVVIALMLSLNSHAQDSTLVTSFSRNTVFTELMGNAFLYSINYDRLFFKTKNVKLSTRGGISYFGAGTGKLLQLPIEANLLLGNKRYFETGLGLLYLMYQDPDPRSNYPYAPLSFRIGYRYQQPKGGFFFRCGYLFRYHPQKQKKYGNDENFNNLSLCFGYTIPGKKKYVKSDTPEVNETKISKPDISKPVRMQLIVSLNNFYSGRLAPDNIIGKMTINSKQFWEDKNQRIDNRILPYTSFIYDFEDKMHYENWFITYGLSTILNKRFSLEFTYGSSSVLHDRYYSSKYSSGGVTRKINVLQQKLSYNLYSKKYADNTSLIISSGLKLSVTKFFVRSRWGFNDSGYYKNYLIESKGINLNLQGFLDITRQFKWFGFSAGFGLFNIANYLSQKGSAEFNYEYNHGGGPPPYSSTTKGSLYKTVNYKGFLKPFAYTNNSVHFSLIYLIR